MKSAQSRRLHLDALEDRTVPMAGRLDPTFGVGGSVLFDFPGSGSEEVRALAFSQPDGKLIVAGNSADYEANPEVLIMRYNADGSLDASFGSGGKRELAIGTYSVTTGVALQADGRIVVSGYDSHATSGLSSFAARLNSDGNLDTSFDGDGIALVNVGFARALAVQGDGKIVVAGATYSAGTGGDFAVSRLNADGSVDTSFDTDGAVILDLGSSWDECTAVAVQADGHFVLAGYSYRVGAGHHAAVARLNSSGSLDASFGADGRVVLLGSPLRVAGLAVQDDGKVVLGGTSGADFAAVRLKPDGNPDGTFDGDGVVTVHFDSAGVAASGVALQPDGRIVLAGTLNNALKLEFAAARLNSDGSHDTSFDADGKVTIDIGIETYDQAHAIGVQADGKIILAGQSYQVSSGSDVALARLTSGGSLDPTFDGDGKVITDGVTSSSSDYVQALAVQSDGKVVSIVLSRSAGARNFVVRQNRDGSLDTSFGTQGKVELGSALGFSGASCLAVQADGKIIVGGAGFGVARLNANGSVDTTFDGDGFAAVDFGPSGGYLYTTAVSMAVQADGKIVAAGYANPGSTGSDFAIARLNSNGSLDTGFDGDGNAVIDLGSWDDIARGVAILPDGKIVVAGRSHQGSTGYDFAAARLNSDGSVDAGFDGDGKAVIDFGSWYDDARGVAVQPDGKIILAGYSNQVQQGTNYEVFAAARLNSDGSLDASFDGDGRVMTGFGPGTASGAEGVAVQPDGKVVLAGWSGDFLPTGWDVALVRYNTDGSLDATFNGTGMVLSDFGSTEEEGAQAVALQPDGQIVIGGWSWHPDRGGYDALIARYQVRAGGYAVLVGSELVVYPSAGDDAIQVSQDGGQVVVTLNGTVLGSFPAAEVGRLTLYGLDGNDELQVAGGVTVPAWLYGGAGNDRLKGGGGHDVLLGGEGDDLLVGGGGRDLIIGGRGADRIVGNGDDDILVAGATAHETNMAALAAIMAEWTSARTYSQRVANVSGQTVTGSDGSTFGSRQNGNYYLRTDGAAATVLEDNVADVLTGGSGSDWFLFAADGAAADRVTDLNDSEFAADLAWIQT